MLTDAQIEQLFRPLPPNRVLLNPQNKKHLAAWDVRRTLTRIFGFTGWSQEVKSTALIFEEGEGRRWTVAYRAVVRLEIRDPHGTVLTWFEEGATGDGQNQPSRSAAHDLAYKSAISTALKRCAINLGDQFGLSLYNKGDMDPAVGVSLAYQSDAAPVAEDTAQVHDDTDPDGTHDTEPAPVAQPTPQAPAVQQQAPPSARDFIAEARAAKAAATVREIYTAAAHAGAAQGVLAEIAEVGRRLASPQPVAAVPAPTPEASQIGQPEGEQRVTSPQMKKMHACFNQFGIKDRGERLHITSVLVGRKVPSANDLSKGEAVHLLDVLERALAQEDPGVALHEVLAGARDSHGAAA